MGELDRDDIAAYLARDDKWYVSGGRGGMYAPTFPRHLDVPGYWDEVYYADQRMDHLYTVLVTDGGGRPVDLPRPTRRWRPDRLTLTYDLPDFRLIEERVIVPNDIFAAKLTVRNKTGSPLKVGFILWGLAVQQDLEGRRHLAVNEVENHGRTISYRLDRKLRGGTASMYIAYGADRDPVGYSVSLAQPADTSPLWRIAPFAEQMKDGRLPNRMAWAVGVEPWCGHLHVGMQYELGIGAGKSASLTVGCAVSFDEDNSRAQIGTLEGLDAVLEAERIWKAYFASVPYFACSDPYLEKYYWYRWYGLKLLTVDIDFANYRHPCVFEGIGYFRRHISYSAQCHMLETRWMHDPALAEGSLMGLAAHQEHTGRIRGAVNLNSLEDYIYHANWGRGVLDLFRVHGNAGFLKQAYPHLERHAEWFLRERDPEHSQLYDVFDQDETGQEYNSRYLAADPDADDSRPIRLKGVDATVYQYELQKALAAIADILGETMASGRWRREAAHTREMVNARMWDPATRMYYDLGGRTLNRISSKPATSFYPFMTDIPGDEHLSALREHLLNPDEFWTPYPVPSASVDDPYFDPQPNWKGKRQSCPWTGRVWPMTNSHLVDALANAARRLDPELAPPAVHLLRRFVRMMFHDGDVDRPNCYEHYNPFTGAACEYRGIDDYQHSWVVDLIIKHVAGLLPQDDDTLVVDPLPFDIDHFTLDNVKYNGHDVKITWRAEPAGREKPGLSVYVDGEGRGCAGLPGELRISL
jgi:hypothetical protein